MANSDNYAAYLDQLIARAEKRLSEENPAEEKQVSPSVVEDKKSDSTAKSSIDKHADLFEWLMNGKEDTKFEMVTPSPKAPAKEEIVAEVEETKEVVEESVEEVVDEVVDNVVESEPVEVEDEEVVDTEDADDDDSSDDENYHDHKAENSLPEPSIFAGFDSDMEDSLGSAKRQKLEKKRLRNSRRALVQQQNGPKRGFFGTIFQILLFALLVAVVILCVLFILQTLAGVEIISFKGIIAAINGGNLIS